MLTKPDRCITQQAESPRSRPDSNDIDLYPNTEGDRMLERPSDHRNSTGVAPTAAALRVTSVWQVGQVVKVAVRDGLVLVPVATRDCDPHDCLWDLSSYLPVEPTPANWLRNRKISDVRPLPAGADVKLLNLTLGCVLLQAVGAGVIVAARERGPFSC
ncbi:hypothetical protein J6590_005173 [Homalodisca vitripennis]|nr:hypothetical protein J6590_005173 [Homalodisca vitripennis]